LSITEWQPFLGAIPPLNDAAWQAEFAKYQLIPEFELVNSGMTLDAFKTIYWWEWSHRLLGRLIGVAFILPLIYFAFRGAIQARLWPHLIILLLLGAAQGGIGWWMVTSGLSERVDVSQYRLAIHLVLACLIFAYLMWVARGLARDVRPWNPPSGDVGVIAALLIVLVFAQIYLGGILAGVDGGLTYNSWPLMDGRWVPDGLLALEPVWRNVFENIATIQFAHRNGAVLLAAVALLHALQAGLNRPDSIYSRRSFAILLLVLLQGGLGIATLMSVVELPLALFHQLLAIGVLALSVVHLRDMVRRMPYPRRAMVAEEEGVSVVPVVPPEAVEAPAAAEEPVEAAEPSEPVEAEIVPPDEAVPPPAPVPAETPPAPGVSPEEEDIARMERAANLAEPVASEADGSATAKPAEDERDKPA
jgi:cytochrome c oxidase assembly protein subunit 15